MEREPAPVIEPDRPTCLECRDELVDSFLFKTFDLDVCDKCKDTEKDGKHELVKEILISKLWLSLGSVHKRCLQVGLGGRGMLLILNKHFCPKGIK